jgi:hypothetical protein
MLPSSEITGSRDLNIRLVRDNAMGSACSPADSTISGSDVHPYTWAADGHLYTANNDPSGSLLLGPSSHLEVHRIEGAVDEVSAPSCPAFARVSQAVAHGVGRPDPLGGHRSQDAWSYSNGITSIHDVLFMVHSGVYIDGEEYNLRRPRDRGRYNGIAYSLDHGNSWIEPGVPTNFSAGHVVSMYFVQEGKDSPNSIRPFNTAPGEGTETRRYLYAITHDREFAGSFLRVGRVAAPNPWDVQTSPRYIASLQNWEWFAGNPQSPRWTGDASAAVTLPGASQTEFLHQRILYPSMAYDAAIDRYLLVLTKMNYAADQATPWCAGHEQCTWRDGGGRVVLFEGPSPWGPFSFVAQDGQCAQTMKYSVQVLTKFQGDVDRQTDEQRLFMTHTGGYGGCWSPECRNSLSNYGEYGTNFRRLVLTVR